MRAPRKKNGRRATATLSARLLSHITLQAQAGGDIVARFDDVALGLGKFSAQAAERAKRLHVGLPLSTFASGNRETDKEVLVLVRRLAGRGLIEYRLGRSQSEDLVVIEPQLPDYWPRLPQLGNADTLALSRFAYMRRRANGMVLESPRAGALFKICDPKDRGHFGLAGPRRNRSSNFAGSRISPGSSFSRCSSTAKSFSRPTVTACGRLRATTPWCCGTSTILCSTRAAPRAATPTRWAAPILTRTRSLRCRPFARLGPEPRSICANSRRLLWTRRRQQPKLLRERHSTRDFDSQRPITLAELARFLDGTARVQSELKATLDHGGDGPELSYTVRPYPSGGASYELELYLAVDTCEGLPRGFYHYDAGAHALVPIETRGHHLDALLNGAEHSPWA